MKIIVMHTFNYCRIQYYTYTIYCRNKTRSQNESPEVVMFLTPYNTKVCHAIIKYTDSFTIPIALPVRLIYPENGSGYKRDHHNRQGLSYEEHECAW